VTKLLKNIVIIAVAITFATGNQNVNAQSPADLQVLKDDVAKLEIRLPKAKDELVEADKQEKIKKGEYESAKTNENTAKKRLEDGKKKSLDAKVLDFLRDEHKKSQTDTRNAKAAWELAATKRKLAESEVEVIQKGLAGGRVLVAVVQRLDKMEKDGATKAEIAAVVADLAKEKKAREDGDNALAKRIAAEEKARDDANKAMLLAIAKAGDATAAKIKGVDDKVVAVGGRVTAVESGLATEKQERKADVVRLDGRIDTEKQKREELEVRVKALEDSFAAMTSRIGKLELVSEEVAKKEAKYLSELEAAKAKNGLTEERQKGFEKLTNHRLKKLEERKEIVPVVTQQVTIVQQSPPVVVVPRYGLRRVACAWDGYGRPICWRWEEYRIC
jgi:hypothetical protein